MSKRSHRTWAEGVARSSGIPFALVFAGDKCILCGRHTFNVAKYIPDDPVKDGFGAPPAGKQRHVPYWLCDKHTFNKATMLFVEAALIERFGGPKAAIEERMS